jgi:glutaredoxin
VKSVVVFSKEGCHLCERVVQTLATLAPRYEFRLEVLDLQDHPELQDEYSLTVPVVRIDDKDVFDAHDMTVDQGYVARLEELVSRYRREGD